MENLKCNNVTIGEKFNYKKSHICEVVDFYTVTSAMTGEIIKYNCIVKIINSDISSGDFEVPFSTVVRNRI